MFRSLGIYKHIHYRNNRQEISDITFSWYFFVFALRPTIHIDINDVSMMGDTPTWRAHLEQLTHRRATVMSHCHRSVLSDVFDALWVLTLPKTCSLLKGGKWHVYGPDTGGGGGVIWPFREIILLDFSHHFSLKPYRASSRKLAAVPLCLRVGVPACIALDIWVVPTILKKK